MPLPKAEIPVENVRSMRKASLGQAPPLQLPGIDAMALRSFDRRGYDPVILPRKDFHDQIGDSPTCILESPHVAANDALPQEGIVGGVYGRVRCLRNRGGNLPWERSLAAPIAEDRQEQDDRIPR